MTSRLRKVEVISPPITATAMGEAFDQSKNDDYFYLPPEAFDNPDFQRGLALFLSPDGRAARFIITHDVDPATEAGISTVDEQVVSAHEAIKGTALASVIGFMELTKVGKTIANATLNPFLVFGFVALFYFVLCFPVSRYAKFLERKFHVAH